MSLSKRPQICWTELCVCRNLHDTSSPLEQIIKSLDSIFKVLAESSIENDSKSKTLFWRENIKLWFRMINKNLKETGRLLPS